MEKERLQIENEILDKLAGKIFLLQDISRKREVIFQTFLEVYNSTNGQALVSKLENLDLESLFNKFLSYGVIPSLSGPYTHAFRQVEHEYLSVSDLSGIRAFHYGCYRGFRKIVINRYFQSNLF